jgi:hypothetical protein
MPRRRQLAAGRKDPHPDISTCHLRRKNERRFREVHLLGNRLHRLGRQPAAIEEHGELVAPEQVIGEDVIVKVAV